MIKFVKMNTLIKIKYHLGFTTIELMVVAAIIAILIGLLLPAVQAARESGRRMHCANNLRQLGIAAHQHHDTHQHLPPGIGYYPTAINGAFGTYFFHLLPFLEQGSLYERSSGRVPFPPPAGPSTAYYPGNNTVYGQSVSVFLCPSDPSVGPDGLVTIDGVSFGASCYAPNALVSAENDLTTNPPTSSPQGMARIGADFADGTSNTILHAEKYARCSNTVMVPALGDGGTAWAYCTSPVFGWLPPPMAVPSKAFQPGFALPALASRGAPDAIGPRSKFQVRPAPFLGNCDPTRASTSHPGGILVGMVDGGVRTLSPSMSGVTWWAALTPSGGEVPGPDW